MGTDDRRQGRRRSRGSEPRRLQVVVRFTAGELEQIRDSAKQDGLAIGAWIGQAALRVACPRSAPDHDRLHRYPNWMVGELLRVRVDVDAVVRRATPDPAAVSQALAAVRRLDALIDAVVTRLS